MTRLIINSLLLLIVLASFNSLASPAAAQLLKDELPDQAKSIDVENRVGEFIPLDLVFKDEHGHAVDLGEYFKQGKPIVMTLNYSDCPGLCVAQLDMLVDTLRDLSGAELGDDFEILTVSIDPLESPEKAARTKAKYIDMLSADGAERGWHFLTGKQADITKLADAVGFRYSYDKANQRYNHAAATYFLSVDGRICRYLLSLGAEPQQFQLAIAEAAEGKLTRTFADSILQMCYMYDPEANRYTASARRMLALAAGAFVVLLTGTVVPFWFAGKVRGARAGADADQAQSAQPPAAEVSSEPNTASTSDKPSRQSPSDPYNSSPSDVSSDLPQAVK